LVTWRLQAERERKKEKEGEKAKGVTDKDT
jgi:hypothetical protein